MPRLLSLLFIFSLLAACQSNKVSVDYDTDAHFNDYHYYQWLEEKSGSSKEVDPLMAARVKEALQQQLPTTGLVKASEQHPADLLVRYFVASSTKSKSSNSSGSVGMGSAGGNTAMGLSMSFPMGDSPTREVQIIIDFLDASEQKVKWRGSRKLKLSDQPPEELAAMVQQAVAEIIAMYPPGKTKK